MTDAESAAWYWCLRHGHAEQGPGCPAEVRLGPYESPEAAAAFAERAEARNERWEDEDRRWHGDEA